MSVTQSLGDICGFVYTKKTLKPQLIMFKVALCFAVQLRYVISTSIGSRIQTRLVFRFDLFLMMLILICLFSDLVSDSTHAHKDVNLLGEGYILIHTNNASAGKSHPARQCVTWHPTVSSVFLKFSLINHYNYST